MKKLIFLLFCVLINVNSYAQNYKNKESINAENLKEKEFYHIQSNGWVILNYGQDVKQLVNFSNKDYILYLSVNCRVSSKTPPSFLIEYNSNYDDKNWAGLDFASSGTDNFEKISFSVDKKEIENPFVKSTDPKFKKFKNVLKNGKMLTIKFLNSQFDPNTGKDGLKINRELNFMLSNNHLLDVATLCKKVEDEAPKTSVLE